MWDLFLIDYTTDSPVLDYELFFTWVEIEERRR
jgi:hypothetical protein